MTTDPPTVATMTTVGRARGVSERARRLATSLRTRILVGHLALLAFAVVASVAMGRQILEGDVHQRIESRLEVGASEIRGISDRTPARRGETPEQRVRRIFAGYLRNNFPPRDGMWITYVGGRPFVRSASPSAYRLDLDPQTARLWASTPILRRGATRTPAGPIEYLAAPLSSDGRTPGVFVAVVYADRATAELGAAVRAAALAGLAVFLAGAVVAWRLAAGVLRPIRALTEAARSITDTDLTRRIEVSGDDETAQLGTTFNAMLDHLQSAFETQRRLLDDASHELRTPITVVRGHLELLDADPRERRATLALVDDELERMNRVVNDLLMLAHAQQPNFLHLETVDLAALTAELCAKAAAIADRRWQCDGAARGIIVADRQRLTQAVMQLADNAARHTGSRDTIAIGTTIERGVARLSVRDTGTGIPADEHDRIFERFARGPETHRLDGAGLGLPIARAIAEAHHGTIDVESRAGGGATFTLTMPVDQPLTL